MNKEEIKKKFSLEISEIKRLIAILEKQGFTQEDIKEFIKGEEK